MEEDTQIIDIFDKDIEEFGNILEKMIEHLNIVISTHNKQVEVIQQKQVEIERLHNIINEIIECMEHELYEHILQNDEETWNENYYTNNKLDYRKLLIGFLEDYINKLKEVIKSE